MADQLDAEDVFSTSGLGPAGETASRVTDALYEALESDVAGAVEGAVAQAVHWVANSWDEDLVVEWGGKNDVDVSALARELLSGVSVSIGRNEKAKGVIYFVRVLVLLAPFYEDAETGTLAITDSAAGLRGGSPGLLKTALLLLKHYPSENGDLKLPGGCTGVFGATELDLVELGEVYNALGWRWAVAFGVQKGGDEKEVRGAIWALDLIQNEMLTTEVAYVAKLLQSTNVDLEVESPGAKVTLGADADAADRRFLRALALMSVGGGNYAAVAENVLDGDVLGQLRMLYTQRVLRAQATQTIVLDAERSTYDDAVAKAKMLVTLAESVKSQMDEGFGTQDFGDLGDAAGRLALGDGETYDAVETDALRKLHEQLEEAQLVIVGPFGVNADITKTVGDHVVGSGAVLQKRAEAAAAERPPVEDFVDAKEKFLKWIDDYVPLVSNNPKASLQIKSLQLLNTARLFSTGKDWQDALKGTPKEQRAALVRILEFLKPKDGDEGDVVEFTEEERRAMLAMYFALASVEGDSAQELQAASSAIKSFCGTETPFDMPEGLSTNDEAYRREGLKAGCARVVVSPVLVPADNWSRVLWLRSLLRSKEFAELLCSDASFHAVAVDVFQLHAHNEGSRMEATGYDQRVLRKFFRSVFVEDGAPCGDFAKTAASGYSEIVAVVAGHLPAGVMAEEAEEEGVTPVGRLMEVIHELSDHLFYADEDAPVPTNKQKGEYALQIAQLFDGRDALGGVLEKLDKKQAADLLEVMGALDPTAEDPSDIYHPTTEEGLAIFGLFMEAKQRLKHGGTEKVHSMAKAVVRLSGFPVQWAKDTAAMMQRLSKAAEGAVMKTTFSRYLVVRSYLESEMFVTTINGHPAGPKNAAALFEKNVPNDDVGEVLSDYDRAVLRHLRVKVLGPEGGVPQEGPVRRMWAAVGRFVGDVAKVGDGEKAAAAAAAEGQPPDAAEAVAPATGEAGPAAAAAAAAAAGRAVFEEADPVRRAYNEAVERGKTYADSDVWAVFFFYSVWQKLSNENEEVDEIARSVENEGYVVQGLLSRLRQHAKAKKQSQRSDLGRFLPYGKQCLAEIKAALANRRVKGSAPTTKLLHLMLDGLNVHMGSIAATCGVKFDPVDAEEEAEPTEDVLARLEQRRAEEGPGVPDEARKLFQALLSLSDCKDKGRPVVWRVHRLKHVYRILNGKTLEVAFAEGQSTPSEIYTRLLCSAVFLRCVAREDDPDDWAKFMKEKQSVAGMLQRLLAALPSDVGMYDSYQKRRLERVKSSVQTYARLLQGASAALATAPETKWLAVKTTLTALTKQEQTVMTAFRGTRTMAEWVETAKEHGEQMGVVSCVNAVALGVAMLREMRGSGDTIKATPNDIVMEKLYAFNATDLQEYTAFFPEALDITDVLGVNVSANTAWQRLDEALRDLNPPAMVSGSPGQWLMSHAWNYRTQLRDVAREVRVHGLRHSVVKEVSKYASNGSSWSEKDKVISKVKIAALVSKMLLEVPLDNKTAGFWEGKEAQSWLRAMRLVPSGRTTSTSKDYLVKNQLPATSSQKDSAGDKIDAALKRASWRELAKMKGVATPTLLDGRDPFAEYVERCEMADMYPEARVPKAPRAPRVTKPSAPPSANTTLNTSTYGATVGGFKPKTPMAYFDGVTTFEEWASKVETPEELNNAFRATAVAWALRYLSGGVPKGRAASAAVAPTAGAAPNELKERLDALAGVETKTLSKLILEVGQTVHKDCAIAVGSAVETALKTLDDQTLDRGGANLAQLLDIVTDHWEEVKKPLEAKRAVKAAANVREFLGVLAQYVERLETTGLAAKVGLALHMANSKYGARDNIPLSDLRSKLDGYYKKLSFTAGEVEEVKGESFAVVKLLKKGKEEKVGPLKPSDKKKLQSRVPKADGTSATGGEAWTHEAFELFAGLAPAAKATRKRVIKVQGTPGPAAGEAVLSSGEEEAEDEEEDGGEAMEADGLALNWEEFEPFNAGTEAEFRALENFVGTVSEANQEVIAEMGLPTGWTGRYAEFLPDMARWLDWSAGMAERLGYGENWSRIQAAAVQEAVAIMGREYVAYGSINFDWNLYVVCLAHNGDDADMGAARAQARKFYAMWAPVYARYVIALQRYVVSSDQVGALAERLDDIIEDVNSDEKIGWYFTGPRSEVAEEAEDDGGHRGEEFEADAPGMGLWGGGDDDAGGGSAAGAAEEADSDTSETGEVAVAPDEYGVAEAATPLPAARGLSPQRTPPASELAGRAEQFQRSAARLGAQQEASMGDNSQLASAMAWNLPFTPLREPHNERVRLTLGGNSDKPVAVVPESPSVGEELMVAEQSPDWDNTGMKLRVAGSRPLATVSYSGNSGLPSSRLAHPRIATAGGAASALAAAVAVSSPLAGGGAAGIGSAAAAMSTPLHVMHRIQQDGGDGDAGADDVAAAAQEDGGGRGPQQSQIDVAALSLVDTSLEEAAAEVAAERENGTPPMEPPSATVVENSVPAPPATPAATAAPAGGATGGARVRVVPSSVPLAGAEEASEGPASSLSRAAAPAGAVAEEAEEEEAEEEEAGTAAADQVGGRAPEVDTTKAMGPLSDEAKKELAGMVDVVRKRICLFLDIEESDVANYLDRLRTGEWQTGDTYEKIKGVFHETATWSTTAVIGTISPDYSTAAAMSCDSLLNKLSALKRLSAMPDDEHWDRGELIQIKEKLRTMNSGGHVQMRSEVFEAGRVLREARREEWRAAEAQKAASAAAAAADAASSGAAAVARRPSAEEASSSSDEVSDVTSAQVQAAAASAAAGRHAATKVPTVGEAPAAGAAGAGEESPVLRRAAGAASGGVAAAARHPPAGEAGSSSDEASDGEDEEEGPGDGDDEGAGGEEDEGEREDVEEEESGAEEGVDEAGEEEGEEGSEASGREGGDVPSDEELDDPLMVALEGWIVDTVRDITVGGTSQGQWSGGEADALSRDVRDVRFMLRFLATVFRDAMGDNGLGHVDNELWANFEAIVVALGRVAALFDIRTLGLEDEDEDLGTLRLACVRWAQAVLTGLVYERSVQVQGTSLSRRYLSLRLARACYELAAAHLAVLIGDEEADDDAGSAGGDGRLKEAIVLVESLEAEGVLYRVGPDFRGVELVEGVMMRMVLARDNAEDDMTDVVRRLKQTTLTYTAKVDATVPNLLALSWLVWERLVVADGLAIERRYGRDAELAVTYVAALHIVRESFVPEFQSSLDALVTWICNGIQAEYLEATVPQILARCGGDGPGSVSGTALREAVGRVVPLMWSLARCEEPPLFRGGTWTREAGLVWKLAGREFDANCPLRLALFAGMLLEDKRQEVGNVVDEGLFFFDTVLCYKRFVQETRLYSNPMWGFNSVERWFDMNSDIADVKWEEENVPTWVLLMTAAALYKKYVASKG